MGKKGGSFWDKPFGGLFDFNRDGKEDFAEQWLAFKIFEECTKKKEETSSPFFGFDDPIDTSWRDYCEDGTEFGIYPEDYEDEDEYNEALIEAKYGWRNTCEDGSEFDVDPNDFETEDEFNDALEEARNAWKNNCEDGIEYGIDTDDYDNEDEYNEALEEARNGWKDFCEDGSEYGLDPDDYDSEDEYTDALELAKAEASALNISFHISLDESTSDEPEEIKESDYPNKRRYNAAYALANVYSCYGDEEVCTERECCQFILDKADTLLAANYLAHDAGFLYAQAIKDNFKLPISLPDEDDSREFEFTQILCKIAKRNIPLTFSVWEWSLEHFLPYAKYDETAASDLTNSVIDDLYSYPDTFKVELVRYMDRNPDFRRKIMSADTEVSDNLPELVCAAIQNELFHTAECLFKGGLQKASGQWRTINRLVESTVDLCMNYSELESMEYFRGHLFPLVKAIEIGMVQDEITEWEQDIDKYIEQVERECEKYVYSRKNSWRKNVPDGSEYGLNPRYYDTEPEYLAALNEAKYRWRRRYQGCDNCGLNPDEYETQEAFREALREKRQEELEERQRKLQEEQQIKSKAALEDTMIYTYCGVLLPFSTRPYSYRTMDESIQIGDKVLVPAGDTEIIGTVVSLGQYMRMAVPFPVEKTKFIISKVSEVDT